MTEQNGVGRSTATDELRRLLDERGVEWDYGIGGAYTTEFSANGVMLNFRDWGDGVICSTILTPEQAIAATLGTGTCHDIAETPRYTDKTRFECSACGYEYSAVGGFGCDYGDSPDFDYCPNCGRKVVDE